MPADCMPRVSPPFDWPASSASISRSAIEPLPLLVGVGHRLDDRVARQRVALRREVAAGDVAGVAAEVHRSFGIGVAIDDALAGVDGRSALRVDHRDLPRVAAGIFVGDRLTTSAGSAPARAARSPWARTAGSPTPAWRRRRRRASRTGTAAPAAKARDWTPTPSSFVAGSNAMIEKVENQGSAGAEACPPATCAHIETVAISVISSPLTASLLRRSFVAQPLRAAHAAVGRPKRPALREAAELRPLLIS